MPPTGTFKIPSKFLAEFTANLRKPGGAAPGTRPVDLQIFKEAINKTLSNPAFAETFAQHVIKQAQLKIR